MAWKVNISDIVAHGYDLDIKNPHRQEEDIQYTSAELLDMLEASLTKSAELIRQLRGEF